MVLKIGCPSVVVVLVLAGCEPSGFTSYQQDFRQVRPLPEGGRVYLENFNGPVEVTGWDQRSVEITGTKYASRHSALEALKIDVVTAGDSIRIRTVRPSGHWGYMGARYYLRVPQSAALERIQTSNGSIRIGQVHGPVRVATSNGLIEIMSPSGPVVARTSNGRIEITGARAGIDATSSNGRIVAIVEALAPGQSIRLVTSNGSIEAALPLLDDNEVTASTSNGSITMRLPAGFSGRVRASTSNSRITNEFADEFKGSIDNRRLDGRIGEGKARLELTTSNAPIRLLRK